MVNSTPEADPPTVGKRPIICQLVHTLNVGGAELLARQFAERASHQFEFVFVCLDSAGLMARELSDAGYVVETLGRRPGLDVRCARRLLQICRQHRVRLIHAHQYAPFFYAAVARLLGWSRLPILFTEHGRDYPDYRRSKRVLANRFLLRKYDKAVAVGKYVRQALIEYEGLPPERISVIYNGVDVEAYATPSGEQRLETRKGLGLAEDDVALIQVARLNPLKDHLTAVRAFAMLCEQQKRARLLIVGDGEERAKIEAAIGEAGVGERVHLLGTRRDIPRLLAASDVFLLTSISEGIPLTLLEAMAAGLPCVSTDVGGTGEVIVDGQTGFLAPAKDAEALAARLAILADHAQQRAAMGVAGRLRSQELFSDRQMHAAYLSLYREMTR